MLTNRPDRAPNLTISGIFVEEGNDNTIFYKLAHNKTNPDRVEHWEIPSNSTFDPNAYSPNYSFQVDGSYAVWTQEIEVPYVTTSGKSRTKKRYDWVYFEPLDSFERTADSSLTVKLKHKQLKDAYADVRKAMNKFNDLFEKE